MDDFTSCKIFLIQNNLGNQLGYYPVLQLVILCWHTATLHHCYVFILDIKLAGTIGLSVSPLKPNGGIITSKK